MCNTANDSNIAKGTTDPGVWVWVWVWVRLRPIDLIISKGCSTAPNPSESALLALVRQNLIWRI